ncbi:MAG: hypothetical protein EXS46_00920 [Candidatus Taylorbacteria bacterium]|nr:hypothetical protein [Candidatus Taylorbacteria bacterium]
MNAIKPLGIEVYLCVLEQLISCGGWYGVPVGKRILLKHRNLPDLRTPFAVIASLLGNCVVGNSEGERWTAVERFVTTTDQISRIIDAEDGRNGYEGYDHALRRQLENIIGLYA